MTAEQLMDELYRLIYETDTISPTADIRIKGEVGEFEFECITFDDIEIELYDTTRNRLYIKAS